MKGRGNRNKGEKKKKKKKKNKKEKKVNGISVSVTFLWAKKFVVVILRTPLFSCLLFSFYPTTFLLFINR